MRIFSTITAALIFASAALGGDSFEGVKAKLKVARCTSIEFDMIVEYSLFEEVDSSDGSACIAHDGRYIVRTGQDIFAYDGDRAYDYSAENNQVVVTADPEDEGSEQISFLTRLDDFYQTRTAIKNRQYMLSRRPEETADVPDSLVVYLDDSSESIDRVEYIDANGDLNRIAIRLMTTDSSCATCQFTPDLPDSVETVRL